MTEQEIKVWVAVYAAVMQGITSNPACAWERWGDTRERAVEEADKAVHTLRARGIIA